MTSPSKLSHLKLFNRISIQSSSISLQSSKTTWHTYLWLDKFSNTHLKLPLTSPTRIILRFRFFSINTAKLLEFNSAFLPDKYVRFLSSENYF